MRLEILLILGFILSDFSRPNFLFDFPVIGNKKKVFYKKINANYFGENYSSKTFFPVYAKTSKMINGNRYGNHIKLKKNKKGGMRNGSK